jgi:septation ring formation regulator EzrA
MMFDEVEHELEKLQQENAQLLELVERLKLEATIHAQEARTANATIAEIYQVVSGGTGEQGNWYGAQPVREAVEKLKAELERLKQDDAERCALIRDMEDDERRMQAELARVKLIKDQHAETLRGVASMPAHDGERMKLWASDSLQGYTETLDCTVLKLQDQLTQCQQREARLREALGYIGSGDATSLTEAEAVARHVLDQVKKEAS